MAIKNVLYARAVAELFKRYGHDVVSQEGEVLSDTVTVRHSGDKNAQEILYYQLRHKNIRVKNSVAERTWTLACTAEMGPFVFRELAKSLAASAAISESTSKGATGTEVKKLAGTAASESTAISSEIWRQVNDISADDFLASIPDGLRRTSSYLTHPVFNTYHSETEMLRYIHHLQSKDLSLTHAMIPLGSCTMKLNATSQMELIGNPRSADVHPHIKISELGGYSTMIKDLCAQLNIITGMDDSTLQPNSGAQGEFAGLRAIRQYLDATDAKRDICLIPSSAHGTNPASAAMAGMRVVMVKCDSETGNLDMADLKAKCEKHKDELAAIMITYPSTFGVFEPDIIKICNEVHEHGGQVYMDGANMNAQIGLTSPGALGADVCHLNLHKTFCIPHGGGGPGVGPICVKSHLSEYLPHKKGQVPVASAHFGSASILPISWAYISVMGKLFIEFHSDHC
jgi:glycine dehydrogenase